MKNYSTFKSSTAIQREGDGIQRKDKLDSVENYIEYLLNEYDGLSIVDNNIINSEGRVFVNIESLRKDIEFLKSEREADKLERMKAINIDKVLHQIANWKIEGHDVGKESEYWTVDQPGWEDHRFYLHSEYSPLHSDDGKKLIKEYVDMNDYDDVDMELFNYILRDIYSGLWSVDLRSTSASTILRYLNIVVGFNVADYIINYRKATNEEVDDTKGEFDNTKGNDVSMSLENVSDQLFGGEYNG